MNSLAAAYAESGRFAEALAAAEQAAALARAAGEDPLPSPTVFSVEPGVYLAGRTGVRIEDLVLLDAAGGRVELLTRFPREPLVLPA